MWLKNIRRQSIVGKIINYGKEQKMPYTKLHALLEKSWNTSSDIARGTLEISELLNQREPKKKKSKLAPRNGDSSDIRDICDDKGNVPLHLIMSKIKVADKYYSQKLYPVASLLLTRNALSQKDNSKDKTKPLDLLDPSQKIEFYIWYLKHKNNNEINNKVIKWIATDLDLLSKTDEIFNYIIKTFPETNTGRVKLLKFKKDLNTIKNNFSSDNTKTQHSTKDVLDLVNQICNHVSLTSPLNKCQQTANDFFKEKNIQLPKDLSKENTAFYINILKSVFNTSEQHSEELTTLLVLHLVNSGLDLLKPTIKQVDKSSTIEPHEIVNAFEFTLRHANSNIIETLYEVVTTTVKPEDLLGYESNHKNTHLHNLFHNETLSHIELLYLMSFFKCEHSLAWIKKNEQGKSPFDCFLSTAESATNKISLLQPSGDQVRERFIAGFSFVIDLLWEKIAKQSNLTTTVENDISEDTGLLIDTFQAILAHANLFELIALRNYKCTEDPTSKKLKYSFALEDIMQDLEKLKKITEGSPHLNNEKYKNFRKNLLKILYHTTDAALFYDEIMYQSMQRDETYFNRNFNWQELELYVQNDSTRASRGLLSSKQRIHKKPSPISLSKFHAKNFKLENSGTGTVIVKSSNSETEIWDIASPQNNKLCYYRKNLNQKKSSTKTNKKPKAPVYPRALSSNLTTLANDSKEASKTIIERNGLTPSFTKWTKKNPRKTITSFIAATTLFVSFVALLAIAIAYSGGIFLGLNSLSTSIATWVANHTLLNTMLSSFNFTGGAVLLAAIGSIFVTGIVFCLSASAAALQYRYTKEKQGNTISHQSSSPLLREQISINPHADQTITHLGSSGSFWHDSSCETLAPQKSNKLAPEYFDNLLISNPPTHAIK